MNLTVTLARQLWGSAWPRPWFLFMTMNLTLKNDLELNRGVSSDLHCAFVSVILPVTLRLSVTLARPYTTLAYDLFTLILTLNVTLTITVTLNLTAMFPLTFTVILRRRSCPRLCGWAWPWPCMTLAYDLLTLTLTLNVTMIITVTLKLTLSVTLARRRITSSVQHVCDGEERWRILPVVVYCDPTTLGDTY